MRPDTTDSTTEPATDSVPQLVLPGQAAAPQGPVDVRMMYLMHFAFRRDLDLFVDAAAATPVSDRDTWSALDTRWRFFTAQLEHHHHGEDAGMWPLLREHCVLAERVILDAMEAEHALIDPLLEQCGRRFADLAAGGVPDDAGTQLSVVVAETRAVLAHHLEHEESEAMAVVQRRLTQQQWDDMTKASFGQDQTVRDLIRTLPWAVHEVPQPQLDDLMRFAGRPFAVLWRLTRRGFERREARLRRHLDHA